MDVRVKTSWEKITGRKTEYLIITRVEVVIGHHYGTGQSDTAGACSHAEFLAGRFHGLIKDVFGGEVLKAAIDVVKGAKENPDFSSQQQEVEYLRSFLDAIPKDSSLCPLLSDPDLINGYFNYGNMGGCRTRVKSTTKTLEYESQEGFIESQDSPGARIGLNFPGHASSVVEMNDVFYLIQGGAFTVLSPVGQILFTTDEVDSRRIFGTFLRIGHVYRAGGRIFFSYHWLYEHDGPVGLIEYVLDKGIVCRCEIENEAPEK